LPILNLCRDAGFSVFAYDYQGYGTSEGRPSERAMYADVTAAYEYLTEQLKTPPQQIISMGRSLGCAAAIDLAARRPVAALVIESPFLSAFRVLTRVQLLPWDRFRNADKIRQIHVPVLVIHGRADRVVPFWQGQSLFTLANEPKHALWLDSAGHNDAMIIAPKKYLETLRIFANSLANSARQ